jgi:hypothetical protein
MDPKTLKVFLGSLLAYTGLFIWMLKLKIRLLRVEGKREPEFMNLEAEGEDKGYET